MNLIEIIGIVATVIILTSMCINTETWKGDVWMRIINLVGSIVFAVYGFLLPAYSTGVLNVLLVLVNAYHLTRLLLRHKKEENAKQEQTDVQQTQDNQINDNDKNV